MIDEIISGLVASLSLYHLILIVVGLVGGIVIGTLPGLSAIMGITLMMPFTLVMPPESGLIMLGAIFVGAIYGGANSAILLNVPGTPSSLATTFDGYPLTKQGRAKEALLGSLTASVVGGVLGVLVLLFFFAPLARIGLQIGPPEYMWLAIFGLTTIVSIASSQLAKGILGAGIGLLMGTVGISQFTGTPRFTFGFTQLSLGIDLVPALVGLFAVSQMLLMVDSAQYKAGYLSDQRGALSRVLGGLRRAKLLLLRSSGIGVLVGMLPGAGGSVASLIAYNESKRWSKRKEEYGTGAMEGVFSSETANNAQVPGTLIPMLGLGIPGSAVAAVMMGGLLSHGIQPGPQLLETSADVAYTFIIALLLANVLLFPVGAALITGTSKVLNAPVHFLIPTILVLAVVGSLAPRGQMFDVRVMVVVGIIAYLLHRVGVTAGPVALGLVLGPIIESNLVLSVNLAENRDSILEVIAFRPVSAVLILLCMTSLIAPLLRKRKKKSETDAHDVKEHQ